MGAFGSGCQAKANICALCHWPNQRNLHHLPPTSALPMATKAYHIVSEYTRPEPTSEEEEDSNEAWSKGHTFGMSKRLLHPPKFVKSSGNYDEYGRTMTQEEDEEIQIIEHRPADIGQWYRNLSRSNPVSAPTTQPSTPKPVDEGPRPSSSKGPLWFVSNVEKRITISEPASAVSSAPGLDEMLRRAPPPLPSEAPFEPPVYTVLGPLNRGYGMLEKGGWKEGRALGLGSSTRGTRMERLDNQLAPTSPVAVHSLAKGLSSEMPETIDLTLSSDEDAEEGPVKREAGGSPSLSPSPSNTVSAHSGRHLLTPLPTVLKADKSGIGSQKGVSKVITQTSEAIRLYAQTAHGRKRKPYDGGHLISEGGAKAIIRKTKKEKASRDALLAYMRA